MLYNVRAERTMVRWRYTYIVYRQKKQIIWLRWEKKIECIYMITYKKDKLNQQIET